jgi:hypothetical protein
MSDIRFLAEEWFAKMVIYGPILPPRMQKPGGLLSIMPQELNKLKSEDVQVPLQKDWYYNRRKQ